MIEAPDQASLKELDRRAITYKRLEDYFTGATPMPRAIVQAQVTNAYKMLMEFAQTNYAKLIVRAATGRMCVEGITSATSAEAAKLAWKVWQTNHLDAESRRLADVVLTHGRAFANCWTDEAGLPTIDYETPDMMIVRYCEGSRYRRELATRRWQDGEVFNVTVSDAEAIYKFTGTDRSGTEWTRRHATLPNGDPEPWPLPHDFGVVPVVEIATNGAITSGSFGARVYGDFQHNTGLLDRINILEFLRLVIAFSQGFPVRIIIGDEILKDDKDQPIAPFKLMADLVAQLENPEAKIAEFKAADLEGFGKAMDRDVETLSGVTQTPSYFLKSVPIQNVSADAIRAADVPLVSRILGHTPFIGEGHEEALRTALGGIGVRLADDAELQWGDVERASLAERADAFQKMSGGATVPWQVAAELALGASPDQVSRWETMGAGNALLTSVPEPGAPTSPTPPRAPTPPPRQ